MRRLVLLLLLASAGCTVQGEIRHLTTRLVENCTYLGGASRFEAKDGVTTRFTCQFVAPTAWVYRPQH